MSFPESPVMNDVDKVNLFLQAEVRVTFTLTKDWEYILETGEQVCVNGVK